MTQPAAAGPRTGPPRLDVFVISWQGHDDKARHIAGSIAAGQPADGGLRLSVIYSNAAEAPQSGAGRWLQLPNACYFGAKFALALREFDADVLLLIQADAACDDWPALVERCRQRFAQRPKLAMWAPRIDYTPWTPARVDIRPEPLAGLTHVAHTDGIVLAYAKPLVQRLQRLDYRDNNIGWGMDWIGICHAYSRGLEVLREDALRVLHPRSRGYDTREATRQWLAFMRQMDPAEQSLFEVLKRYSAEPEAAMKRLRRWLTRRIRGAARRGRARP